MKKTTVVLRIVGITLLTLCSISNAAGQADFSGVWILDKGMTPYVPRGLKSYRMIVTQNDQKLIVKTDVEGDVQPPDAAGHILSGYLSPGIGANTTLTPGSLAFNTVIPELTYLLDGTATTTPIRGFEGAPVRLKAKWDKDMTTLQLSFVQDQRIDSQSRSHIPGFTNKERWTLSEGGETLTVRRRVTTGLGADTVNFIFRKGKSEPAPTQQ